MKKKILFFLTILLTPFIINAEELKMEWQRNFGGSDHDYFNNFITLDNGDIIAIGYTNSTDIEGLENHGSQDVVIVKYDKDGNLLWQKSFGGSENDIFSNFKITENGDIIVYGYTYSTDIEGMDTKGNIDAFIVKYDKDGNIVWQTPFSGSDADYFSDIIITKSDDLIAFGYTKSSDIEGITHKGKQDAVIVKYDKDGNLLWQKRFGGSEHELFSDLRETKNGDLIAFGYTKSTDIEGLENHGSQDVVIVKYDKDGNLLWQKSFGGSQRDNLLNFTLTKNEDIIVQIETESIDIEGLITNGKKDAVIVKYDKDGTLLWQNSFGGSDNDSFDNFILTDDENIIAYGYITSTDIEGITAKGSYDEIIIKYDKAGNILWQKSFAGNKIEVFYDLKETKNGDIIASGYTSSTDIDNLTTNGNGDAIVVKYDKDGNLLWKKSLGEEGNDSFRKFIITKNEDIITFGFTSSINEDGEENFDDIIVKYDKDGNLLWQKRFGESEFEQLNNFIVNEMNEIIMSGYTKSTDIEGLTNKGDLDAIIVKYLIEYNLENVTTENGTAGVEQKGNLGVITPTPDKGYEVDKIIVKDKNGDVLDVEITKLDDGTYSFPLYTDVSVEVLFKEALSNPKTGVFDYISFILIGLLISFIGYNVINYNNQKFEL